MRVRGWRLAAGIALILAALMTSGALALRGGPEASWPQAQRPPAEGGDAPAPPAPAPARPAPDVPPAFPEEPELARAGPLEIGLTEFNPALITTGDVPAAFAPWREATAALRPDRFRLVVDWGRLQPDPGEPADLAHPEDGCLRGQKPCRPFAGLRDMLRALAERRRADGGWEVVVVLANVPAWAARPPGGCERPGASPRSRPLSASGHDAYRRLIRRLRALGRDEGVPLDWWSPWNEPNHPAFISPQRPACSPTSVPVSPAIYTELVRLAREELAGTPARLVLGELAGFRRPSARATGVGEFVRALPDDVVCAAGAWAQHEYASPVDEPAGPFSRDAVAEVEAALAERPCARDVPIWVTETGVGGTRPGDPRPRGAGALAGQCAAQAARLERWAADERVEAAFQYLVREDTAYPVGLADPALRVLYPTHGLWLAWAGAQGDAPPPRPAGCGAA